MTVINEWAEAAIQKGLALERESLRNMVLRQLPYKVGEIPPQLRERVAALDADTVDLLAMALFSMRSPLDLERWLAAPF